MKAILRRTLTDLVGVTTLRVIVAIMLVILFYILFDIARLGLPVITWTFLTDIPREGMTQGGIFPAIFGTLTITILMILLALPLGVFTAIYLAEYGGEGWIARTVRAAVHNLAGVPSIIFGLFGLGFFILFVGTKLDHLTGQDLFFGQPAMLWAAATLAILVLPVVIVSTEEALKAVPREHRESSYALGATKWETIRRVVLPQCRSAILTGAILSIARGAGETAPILFTGCAYFLPHLPVTKLFGVIPKINPFSQFMELSYHIFIMATQSINPTQTRPIQYGTTLVLLGLTFLLNLFAMIMRYRFRKAVGAV
jgi:phosphate transport system permease protein